MLSFVILSWLSTNIQLQSLEQLNIDINPSSQINVLSEPQLSMIEKLPSIGFRNIVANWSFIQFIQYFGEDEARRKTGYGKSADFYLSTTIQHDPYFRDFYIFLIREHDSLRW